MPSLALEKVYESDRLNSVLQLVSRREEAKIPPRIIVLNLLMLFGCISILILSQK
jgi:hypothetical protein